MKKDIYVVGAVIKRDGKILCAQRGSTKTLAHKWEFPGGKIETGETPKEALVRELREEMLCDIEVGEQVDHTVYEYDFGIVHLTTFLCEITNGEPELTEHAAIKWLPPEEISSLDWAPADIPAIEVLSQMAGRI
ncbi:(deoxy)nucleoside triphosphate pyrophosphohydrolase [Aciduricibacillus chroicocephali]|uniref:8-oxo-dGTP diphosphatase n=1 Tax=Aciduricibacillus chroicocephali TaxID=3054939 RepID=A0ABY9KWQ0_9BACI|nr:(deoxy)nucleoside triphosphate pyrophosphohydrolase [Bacillaceae bacterium 44XB]